jgi:hypothetical protein
MKDSLFLASDLWLMATTWTYGIRLWRNYRNQLLTLEWLVVAVSSTNFLLWSVLGGDKSSPMYDLAYALDAFSRSFGITLILVIGLLSVTHGYKPPTWVKLGATGLAVAGALVLGRMHNDHLVHDVRHVALAVFYVVTNLLTTVFLAYFVTRLWRAGETRIAILTGLVTAAATYVAVTYDFFPFSFDDADRTIFYTIALTTWGAQAITYYYAYKAMREHNGAVGQPAARPIGAVS